MNEPINFLDPIYYDVSDIHPDAPNKPLLIELFARMNEQNERLWEFFTEMTEDPEWKAMKASMIKPRQHRRKRKADKKKYKRDEHSGRMIEQPSIDNPDSDEFMDGYKAFLKDEFGDS